MGHVARVTFFILIHAELQLINPKIEIKMVENTPDDPRQRKPDITNANKLLGWEQRTGRASKGEKIASWKNKRFIRGS